MNQLILDERCPQGSGKTPSGYVFMSETSVPKMLYNRGGGSAASMKTIEEIKQKIREKKI